MGDVKQEEAVSLAKELVLNLYESGNVFVHISPTSGSTLPQAHLSKRSQKLLMRYDSSSVLGVGGRNDTVDSPWNTPKVKRAKTPLFSDWSPFNGNVDDSLLLSRKQSVLKLAIPTEKLHPHAKPWDTNRPGKVKLKASPVALERAASQKALSIYSTTPSSPKYSNSPFKKSPSPRKKKSIENLKGNNGGDILECNKTLLSI